MKQTFLDIEQNLKSRIKTDKIMWFSMWVVLSVASFGIAWFPMIYFLIKRRNAHFSRREKFETLILSKLKNKESPEKSPLDSSQSMNQWSNRSPQEWTILTLLIFPAFYIFYFLNRDLRKHEEHEHDFLVEVIALTKDSVVSPKIQDFTAAPSFQLDKYLVLSVVTFGLAAAYWLYRIFNDYNNHFRMQWKNEDALLSFIKTIDKKTG